MPFSEPNVHHVTQISVEALDEPACITLTFLQALPVGTNTIHRDDASIGVHLSADQDGADAYMLAAAIMSAQSSYDNVDSRRVRAAICLGWRPTVDPKTGVVNGWERPWREGDPDDDNPQHADDVQDVLMRDLIMENF